MKRSYEQEMMDSPNQPQDLLEEDLKNLRLFNRFLGGYRCVESAIAEVVYQAATDESDHVTFVAGEDAKTNYARRLEGGIDAFRAGVKQAFLG